MTDKTKTPDAPLVMPPVADFIAWLRANPDRVFPAKPDDDRRIGMMCPVGVFAREHNKGEFVGVGLGTLLRVCGDATSEHIYIDRTYGSMIVAFDNHTDSMSRDVTARELLIVLDKAGLA